MTGAQGHLQPWHSSDYRSVLDATQRRLDTRTRVLRQKGQPLLPVPKLPPPSICFPSLFSDVQVDECNMVKMKTAALINPVFNLSQSLKLAAIGLIVVNHVCQWCRKVQGILLPEECIIKSAAWEQLRSII